MKVVVDEGVPRHLVEALRTRGIDANRFRRRQWSSLSNGELLKAVEASGFSVLVTDDKNIADQNSLAGRSIAVVAIPHNRRRPILERADDIADTIVRSKSGQLVTMEWDGTRVVRYVEGRRVVFATMPAVAPFASG